MLWAELHGVASASTRVLICAVLRNGDTFIFSFLPTKLSHLQHSIYPPNNDVLLLHPILFCFEISFLKITT